MTKIQWAILGTLAVAVLCVFGALGFVVVRDLRRDVSSVAVASTPTTTVADSTSTAQKSGGAVLATPTPQAGTGSGQAGAGETAAPSKGAGTAETPGSSGATGGVSAFTGELPADPQAAAKLIQTEAQAIQSAHIVMDFSVQMQATPPAGEGSPGMPFPDDIKVAAEGDFVNHGTGQTPDVRMTLRVQAQGESHTIEFVQVDGRQWVNTEGKWEENKDFQQKTANGGDFTTNPLTMLFAMKAMGNVDRLPDENIDGVPTYHYRFTVDPQKLLSSEELSNGPVNSSMFASLFQDLTLQVEVWADQEHLWMRQEKLLLHAKMAGPAGNGQPASSVEIQVEGLIKLSRFNQPVTIKPPV
ncbi:MAG: hypothetical protein GXP41_05360 [Chloroflexi bacterium]|nr:hypothetical protein [Chloroflexota bacterium]